MNEGQMGTGLVGVGGGGGDCSGWLPPGETTVIYIAADTETP